MFTTRPDTLWGATFMSLAPEHPLALALAQGTPQEEEVRRFVEHWRAAEQKPGGPGGDHQGRGIHRRATA